MRRTITRPYLWAVLLLFSPAALGAPTTRAITWDDIAPGVQALLSTRGIDRATLPAHVTGLRKRHAARMRDGDLDHLVHYMLQSTTFTRVPPIEPAVSAREFVTGGRVVPRDAATRIASFVEALQKNARDERLRYFRSILMNERSSAQRAAAFVSREYARAMEFLYAKEFGRPNSSLYQERGLSTDTSVDAGYVVYLALGALKQLEPDRRIARVLIVGPGMDLAPRTSLVESAPPQSVQPVAVTDALLALGLADVGTLEVRAVDINPRVVEWIAARRGKAARLTVTSGVAESIRTRLTDDYRDYLTRLGRAVGRDRPLTALPSGHVTKIIEVSAIATRPIDATVADISVDRLDERYDLVIVTNVFPYLSDTELLLALANIQSMLAPGGVLLHNEARPLLAETTLALNLQLIHSRSAVLATVKDASPLYDSIWMHRR